MDGLFDSKNQLRQLNGKLVLQNIFNNSGTSRAQIARDLKLNKSTVSSIYNDLMATDIIQEGGDGAASNNGGRKPTMVSINAHYGFTVSLDIAYRNLHYMFNYLNGDIIEASEIRIFQKDIHEIMTIIIDLIKDVSRKIESDNGLVGIAVSYHGIVDVKEKEVTYSPFLDLDGVKIVSELEQTFSGVDVLIDNESNVTALYERDFDQHKLTDNSITISIHKGIGSGIIINRRVFRGSDGEAGEIGRGLINMDGQNVKVEDICSEDAIINSISAEYGEVLYRNDVVRLYRKSNPIIVKHLDVFVDTIGLLIYNVGRSFNPQSFFISSPLIEEMPEMLNAIEEKIKSLGGDNYTVFLIDNADRATLLGACSLITHEVLGLRDYELQFFNENKLNY